MHSTFKLTLAMAALLALGGCRSTYLLTSKFVVSAQAEKLPEIIETPTYIDSHSRIYTVAVRAPDSCSNQTAASATGDARASGTILKTECGVEMAELERALAKKGYRVISWKVLARELSISGKSAGEVASTLGAEVLFQINSLEKSQKSLGKDARWERNYFLSNEYGDRLGEQLFDEPTRQFLRSRYLLNSEQRVERYGLSQPSVTLDANAVMVATGESIWYYQWTHADASGMDYKTQALISCKSDNRECQPLAPLRRAGETVATETKSSGDSDAVSVSEQPEDLLAAKQAVLLSAAIKNLVESFSKGQMVVRPIAPPPPPVMPTAAVEPAVPMAPAAAEAPVVATPPLP